MIKLIKKIKIGDQVRSFEIKHEGELSSEEIRKMFIILEDKPKPVIKSDS